eukprot:635069-Amphidinium_carterae.1
MIVGLQKLPTFNGVASMQTSSHSSRYYSGRGGPNPSCTLQLWHKHGQPTHKPLRRLKCSSSASLAWGFFNLFVLDWLRSGLGLQAQPGCCGYFLACTRTYNFKDQQVPTRLTSKRAL